MPLRHRNCLGFDHLWPSSASINLRGDAIEQLAQSGAKLGLRIVILLVQHPGCDGRRQRREPVAVQQPSKQSGVLGTIDVGDLDIQSGRAADVVQYRHDRRQLVPLGQAGTAQRGKPGIQPRQLSRVCRRARRGSLQDPRVPVVDVP